MRFILPHTVVAMRLAVLMFLSLTAMSGHHSMVSGQDDLADVITRSERSVVRIEVDGLGGAALGSGFVVGADGLMVTNVHVMAGASKAIAKFADGRSHEITGTYVIDVNRDICVARLAGSGFDPIILADALPRKGEQVVALGSPRGLSFSATRGIVSAIREQNEFREMVGRPKIEGTWVQIDAAISGGNSGGPLINSRGEVVAMSTLGSAGDAQNLNFGISVDDIRVAVDKAKQSRIVDLRTGVGRIEMAEVSPEATESMITRGEIPVHALEDYIERGRLEYRELAKDLRTGLTREKKVLDWMRSGETYIPPGASRSEVAVERFPRIDRYYFRNESVKRRRVAEQQSLVSRLERVKNQLGREADDESLFALLMNGGPWLDPRGLHKIGYMYEGIVLHAFNEHDVIVIYNELPYLMWVKSTAGLSTGQKISPTPVYVAGTETMAIPGVGSQSVTILNSVTETEIREAIFGKSSVSHSSDEFRTWTDSTGQYTIEAKLVEVNGSQVVLEKPDGTTVKLLIEKLSLADQRHIEN